MHIYSRTNLQFVAWFYKKNPLIFSRSFNNRDKNKGTVDNGVTSYESLTNYL